MTLEQLRAAHEAGQSTCTHFSETIAAKAAAAEVLAGVVEKQGAPPAVVRELRDQASHLREIAQLLLVSFQLNDELPQLAQDQAAATTSETSSPAADSPAAPAA